MESPFAPLSEACAKTLWDKTYEKRKVAAAEIEKYKQNKWHYNQLILSKNWFTFIRPQNGDGIQFDQKLQSNP